MPKNTEILMHMGGNEVREFSFDEFPKADLNALAALGITMDEHDSGIKQVMDALPATITTPSITTPVQFLQYWLPGSIQVVTRARTSDLLVGRTIAGSWETEEVVATIMEHIGQTRIYGDRTNVPLANYNANFEKRTNVRLELGLMTGKLEEARASAMRINAYNDKRAAVAQAFAIDQNLIAYLGFNGGNNKTYGVLNDPNISAFVNVDTGAAGTTPWSTKTFAEICKDVNSAVSTLRIQTGTNFNPYKDSFKFGVASASFDFLNTMNTQGNLSVRMWIQQTFPKCDLIPIPEFNAANGTANVFYMIADKVTVNNTVDQFVTSALRLVGVELKAKGIIEDYTCSTAGVLFESPIGVVRYSGI